MKRGTKRNMIRPEIMVLPQKKREGFSIEPKLSLPEYIKEKVKVLHQLGYYKVTKGDFATCTSEVQVDNKARSIIMAA